MKRILLLLCALAVVTPAGAASRADTLTAAQLRTVLQDSPAKAGGPLYMYPFEPYSVAAPPKGYVPVYISHYGRHGARYVTNSARYALIEQAFQKGYEAKALTEQGEEFARAFHEAYPRLKGHNGDLTLQGQNQHRRLARRMVEAYPAVFGKEVTVDARSTTVPRAIISMNSFLDEIRQLRPEARLSFAADHSDLPVTMLAPEDGDESKEFSRLRYGSREYLAAGRAKAREDIGIDADAFMSKYFTDLSVLGTVGKTSEIASTLSEVLDNVQCLDFDPQLPDLRSPEEIYRFWQDRNISSALIFTGNPYSQYMIPVRAGQLLTDIISLADSDMEDGQVKVRLRFGHDTIVAPLMGFLGIDGWGLLGEDMTLWKYRFQNWNIPMASNAQFIFYRNKKKPHDILVRLMYNEKDQILPLEDQSMAPYYRWSDFKARYIPECGKAKVILEGYRSGNPIIKVESGQLQGVPDKDVLTYKGVPFAAPPVGSLHGKAPQKAVPWEGVFKADKFPAAAMQAPFSPEDPLYYREFYSEGSPEFSEDCLYLNIWAPADAPGKPETKAPVAVWIHGGALNHGYSFEKEMDGREWAKRGVVLVTIPYRLGETGFGKDGLLGFQDQVAALRWVHDNIAAFGGDPSNVTVFGQSAGAISVKYLLTNPEARPLFAKAIIQSGGGVNEMDYPGLMPDGTRGENAYFKKAMQQGCFDGKPVMIGWVGQDFPFLGKEAVLEFCRLKTERHGTAPVFAYDFERDLPGEQDGELNFGAFHSAELWYVFGTLDRCWRTFTEADYKLSARMLDAWTSFARSGDPGWQAFDEDTEYVEVFDIPEE